MSFTIAVEHKEVGNAVWGDFLPTALETGQIQAKPDPIVISGGLPQVQHGLDRQREGVSAAKVVVKL